MHGPGEHPLPGFVVQRSLQRVGGTETLQADVRVVAATNRDIEHEVEEGRFRRDLFYRLNVIPIPVPPLWASSCSNNLKTLSSWSCWPTTGASASARSTSTTAGTSATATRTPSW